MMRLMNGSFMTVTDAARLLKVSRNTVIKYLDRGLIKGHRLASPGHRDRRFTPEAFRAFLVAQGLSTEAFDAEIPCDPSTQR